MRFNSIVPIGIFVSFAAFPEFVPEEFFAGGFSFRLSEPFLFLAFLWALRQPSAVKIARYIVPFMALCVVVTMWSLVEGANLNKTGSDVRLPFYAAIAMFIASKVVGTPLQERCVKAVLVTLWFSASMVLLSAGAGIKLGGRSEAASVDPTDITAATRYLTPTDFVAVSTVAICLIFVLSGKPRSFKIWYWLLPAVVLMVFSFSRNHLLGLFVASVFAVLAFRTAASFVATVRVATIIGLVVVFLEIGGGIFLLPLPGGKFVVDQAHGYTSRVVEGLTPEVRASDPSVKFREDEIVALQASIEKSPWVGHGFGYAYKAPKGLPGTFFHESAPYYSHNFYLWLWVKTGVVGLLAFAWMAVVPLVRVLVSSKSTLQVALAGTVAGLLAISWFAPIPNGTPETMLFGALLGAIIALYAPKTASKSDDVAAVPVRT